MNLSVSPPDLKADLHARIEAMDDAHLKVVERLLLALKIEDLVAQLDAGFEADRQAGLLTEEKVQAAIKEFRAAHPYR